METKDKTEDRMRGLCVEVMELFARRDVSLNEGYVVLSSLLTTAARDNGMPMDELVGRFALLAESLYSQPLDSRPDNNELQ